MKVLIPQAASGELNLNHLLIALLLTLIQVRPIKESHIDPNSLLLQKDRTALSEKRKQSYETNKPFRRRHADLPRV